MHVTSGILSGISDYAHVCEHNHIGKKDRKMESSGQARNGVTCEKHLVYDRVSENGKCDLFVYQQEQVGADAKILGFYAVKKGTGQVISADKTAWGGVSSKEYKDATGED